MSVTLIQKLYFSKKSQSYQSTSLSDCCQTKDLPLKKLPAVSAMGKSTAGINQEPSLSSQYVFSLELRAVDHCVASGAING